MERKTTTDANVSKPAEIIVTRLTKRLYQKSTDKTVVTIRKHDVYVSKPPAIAIQHQAAALHAIDHTSTKSELKRKIMNTNITSLGTEFCDTVTISDHESDVLAIAPNDPLEMPLARRR